LEFSKLLLSESLPLLPFLPQVEQFFMLLLPLDRLFLFLIFAFLLQLLIQLSQLPPFQLVQLPLFQLVQLPLFQLVQLPLFQLSQLLLMQLVLILTDLR